MSEKSYYIPAACVTMSYLSFWAGRSPKNLTHFWAGDTNIYITIFFLATRVILERQVIFLTYSIYVLLVSSHTTPSTLS